MRNALGLMLKNKSDCDLIDEVNALSMFGPIVGMGFIVGGLICEDLIFASGAPLVGVVCFVRITMIRRIQKARLADHFKSR